MHARQLTSKHSAHSLLALCTLGFFVASCGERTVAGVDRAATIDISPERTTVAVGESMSLEVSVRDQLGDSLGVTSIHWSSSDTSIARVSESGVVSARKPGEVTIAATFQGVSDVATVRVTSSAGAPQTPSVVTRIEVEPAFAVVRSSGKPDKRRARLTAFAYDANGNIILDRKFVWSSDNTSTATVSASGLVTGQRAGAARITASTEGVFGSASIVVVK